MKYIFLATLLFTSMHVEASNHGDYEVISATDTLEIAMDLDSAYAHYTSAEKSEMFEGYTIQIFSGDRVHANQVRGKILAIGADKEARMVYREPNFKIHIGSYPDVATAERALMSWKVEFPDAFVVQTLVPWYELDLEHTEEIPAATTDTSAAPSDTSAF